MLKATASFFPRRLQERTMRRAEALARPFQALHDVSFALKAGESLGIIGRNGSGKSTLLQILAGTLTPTSGRFAVRGRVAALLELGSGFNPEFSGRENVLLQAALAGVPRTVAMQHFEEVAEFAGIGEFIEHPVKTYSSGMMVRLAFATQTILRPDVFIVDEALAVGDVFFQAKCARFFQQRLVEGMSLLFVSHDLVSVKALCRQALVLHEGHVAFLGDSASAVSHFHALHSTATAGRGDRVQSSPNTKAPRKVALPEGAVRRNWAPTTEIGSREAEIVHCRVCDAKGNESRSFFVGEPFYLEVFVEGRTLLDQVQFSVEIADRHSRVLYGASTVHLGQPYRSIGCGEVVSFKISFLGELGAGDYLIDAAVGMGDRGDGAPAQHVHRVAQIASVTYRHRGLSPAFFGPVNLKAVIESPD